MNIQDKMQEIHHKYGVSEMANYKIELFIEALLKEQKEQLILSGVSGSTETDLVDPNNCPHRTNVFCTA